MTYATMIEDLAPPGHDPRHIEAIMRMRNPTLDGLLPGEFRKEVSVAVACIVKLGTIKAEEIAQSLGFINSDDNKNPRSQSQAAPEESCL
jgi:hypothetical protein